ncbi:ankyrin repeat domain-containing protein [Actinocrispum sp. NPDC049592]|uniref:ankyrin repeat domain-containing protein n=1 Tax=Actinocrispum sp. NPDC049592 TaxID=3154835 RepID=UPI00344A7FF8
MSLPPRPDLDQLRRQAKELRRAEGIPLAAAQLRIAREHGFASWPKLKAAVESALMDRAARAAALVEASMTGRTGRAARLLAEDPGVAHFDVRTAAVLGDIEYVRAAGPSALDDLLRVVTHSHWHRIDPDRAPGMLDVARFLLDEGADPNSGEALYGASGIANNPAMTELLLQRGADPNDGESLYHSAYHAPDHRCLRLLLAHGARVDGSNAIGSMLDTGDVEGLRLLLEAGGTPSAAMAGGVLQHAIRRECTPATLETLLSAGADPDFQDCHPFTPIRLAVRLGRLDLVEVLLRHGATDDSTDADRFVGACARADRAAAERLRVPLEPHDEGMIVFAAEYERVEPIELMLDMGFPVNAVRPSDGATALHVAAYSGQPELVSLLLARGADLDVVDTRYGSTPRQWAEVGSEHRGNDEPVAGWAAVINLLDGAAGPRS